jgi:hypothetical protein
MIFITGSIWRKIPTAQRPKIIQKFTLDQLKKFISRDNIQPRDRNFRNSLRRTKFRDTENYKALLISTPNHLISTSSSDPILTSTNISSKAPLNYQHETNHPPKTSKCNSSPQSQPSPSSSLPSLLLQPPRPHPTTSVPSQEPPSPQSISLLHAKSVTELALLALRLVLQAVLLIPSVISVLVRLFGLALL